MGVSQVISSELCNKYRCEIEYLLLSLPELNIVKDIHNIALVKLHHNVCVFKKLPSGMKFPAVLGSKKENIKKNRFKNIIACNLLLLLLLLSFCIGIMTFLKNFSINFICSFCR